MILIRLMFGSTTNSKTTEDSSQKSIRNSPPVSFRLRKFRRLTNSPQSVSGNVMG